MAVVLAVASAVLVAAAFPPLGQSVLAWVGLAPLFVALRRVRTGPALGLAVLWLVVFAALVGLWFPRAVATYFDQPWWVGLAFFAGVTATMGAPYYVAFAVAYRILARRPGLTTPLLVAAAWTATELARGRLLTGSPIFIGNPWGLLGYSQVGIAPLVQIASLTGVYGVTFVVAAVNAAVAEAWLARHEGTARRAALGLALATVPAVVALVYGAVVLARADVEEGRPTRVAIVQGNVDVGSTWRSDHYGLNLDLYLRLTRDVLSAEGPRVVFWPEGAMTFFLEQDQLYRAAIRGVLRVGGAELVAGGPSAAAEPGTHWNSIFLVSSEGEILGRYDKQYLVPFTEYFPLGGVDVLRRRFERVRVYTPGPPRPPLPTAAGRAGVLTCNEAMLPEVVGARVAEGAEYLVNPSNDSWLSDRQYSAQQFDIVTMRAVEQRRYLVRASTSGPSAIVDPWGRVQVATAMLAQAVAAGTIRTRSERSAYGRVGDAFGIGCVLVVAVTVAGALRRPTPPGARSRG
jgi:apolipoprotein N-acyltransferase